MPDNFETFIALAHALADASGRVISEHFGNVVSIETKADSSPVSIADKEAERVMRELIVQAFPNHSIFGEEHGAELSADSKYTWVLDPIDGTRAFLEGKKEWGTLIALCENGVPILGMLNQPITGERWLGVAGKPTTLNDASMRVRICEHLADAEISTTSAAYFTPPEAASFVTLAKACKHTVAGGDCYAYGMLARGGRDIVLDMHLKPYDILALVPIIEGSGGTIRTLNNHAVTMQDYANVIACGSPELMQKAFKQLQA